MALYTIRGAAYGGLKEYPKAITDNTKAIDISPQYAEAYSNRGIAYSQVGNTLQAKQNLQTAAQLFQKQGKVDLYEKLIQLMKSL